MTEYFKLFIVIINCYSWIWQVHPDETMNHLKHKVTLVNSVVQSMFGHIIANYK